MCSAGKSWMQIEVFFFCMYQQSVDSFNSVPFNTQNARIRKTRTCTPIQHLVPRLWLITLVKNHLWSSTYACVCCFTWKEIVCLRVSGKKKSLDSTSLTYIVSQFRSWLSRKIRVEGRNHIYHWKFILARRLNLQLTRSCYCFCACVAMRKNPIVGYDIFLRL